MSDIHDFQLLMLARHTVPTGVYRHYKGDTYTVEDYSLESTNGRDREVNILYRSHKTGLLNSRVMREFCEKVNTKKDNTGDMVPRFRREDG